MYGTLSYKSKLFSEKIAKYLRKSAYVDIYFNDLFYSMMHFFRSPFGGSRASSSWCEIQKNLGYCQQPNGLFCSEECRSGYGLTTRCPQGFQPSHAWGFRITGCWCDTYQGRSVVCCDCTPITNSPYSPSTADCGCMHFLDQ